MPDRGRGLQIAYFAHTFCSDWNNGNAHFLRGLMRALTAQGCRVRLFEPEDAWSRINLLTEEKGAASLEQFSRIYDDLMIETYAATDIVDEAPGAAEAREQSEAWEARLAQAEIVIVHEWNPPALAQRLLALRQDMGFRLLFHDTHHRASSSPEQMRAFGLERFDGVLAFGESLRGIYREQLGLKRVWTLHEAADTTVFHPQPALKKQTDAVWIGNWGEDERAAEISAFYLEPAEKLAGLMRFALYGVRYPAHALAALARAHVAYKGYVPNLEAPAVYAAASVTVHIPRQQYSTAMRGIPTIRVFEALACGIPLVSAPWDDSEQLFRAEDFCRVEDSRAMVSALEHLLRDRCAAEDQAARGLETILARHTCTHRAQQLTAICEEVLA